MARELIQGPSAKAHRRGVGFFPGALKRSFPRMNAGAPTQMLGLRCLGADHR